MKQRIQIVFLLFLALTSVGCQVDPSFDFSNLDTTMTVLKNAQFPVPAVRLTLQDLYPLDDVPFIRVDAADNYLIRFDVDPFQIPLTVPESDSDRIPIDFQPVEYAFRNIPDLLSGKDRTVAVDLSEMVISMTVASTVPAAFTVNAVLESVRSGEVETRCRVEGLTVTPSGREVFSLVAKEHPDLPSALVVPGLEKLLNPIPDALRITELEISSEASERAKVDHSQRYEISCEIYLESPILFSEGTYFHRSMTINASLNLEQIGLKKALLPVDIENSLPLDFAFSIEAQDEHGNPVDGIAISTDFDRIPGIATTSGTITLTAEDDIRFSRLNMELTASALAENPHDQRTYLNRQQGLYLSNMSLYLPDGIQIHLDSSAQ